MSFRLKARKRSPRSTRIIFSTKIKYYYFQHDTYFKDSAFIIFDGVTNGGEILENLEIDGNYEHTDYYFVLY